MFFLFSKLLSFLLSPFFWVIILLFFALFAKKANKKRNYLILSILLLFLFSNAFLSNEMANLWEAKPVPLNNVGKYDYAIVLGGFSAYDTTYAKVKFFESSDRLWQALQLYHLKKVKKIFISGGSGKLMHQEETEADKVKAFLISLNVPECDIVMEMTSRNTHENAMNTALWLKKHHSNAKCLLVTSAGHMRRAMGCFRKENVNVTSYPTHYFAARRTYEFDRLVIPSVEVLMGWQGTIKEMFGYLTYQVMRYC
jgi:uncharacterized SAM-binding protein YcdF (DUF218 family)